MMTWPETAPAQKFNCDDRQHGNCSALDVVPVKCENFELCGDLVCPSCGGDVVKVNG